MKIDLTTIYPSKENVARLLSELNNDLIPSIVDNPPTQEEWEQLTHDKRVEEAEQADRSELNDFEDSYGN